MRRLLSMLLAVLLFNFLISCDYKDIDRRIFITALGIDSAPNNQIMVTMKGALTKQKNETNQENYKTFTTTADTIGTAFRHIKALSNLEPDYGHLKSIVFGIDFFNHGDLEEIMDFLMKRRDVQKLSFMLVGNPSAKAIMEFQPKAEDIAGSAIFLRFGQGSRSQYSKKAKMSDLFTAIKTPGITPIMSIIEIDKEDYRIDKMAVLDKNFKVVDILQKDECKIFNILRHKINYGFILSWDSKTKKTFGVNIQKTNVKYNIYKSNDTYYCDISVKLKVSIEEGSIKNTNRELIAKEVEKQVKDEAMHLVKKLQADKVDPLRLEISYWQKNGNYQHTNDWFNKIFPAMSVNIIPKIILDGEGVTD